MLTPEEEKSLKKAMEEIDNYNSIVKQQACLCIRQIIEKNEPQLDLKDLPMDKFLEFENFQTFEKLGYMFLCEPDLSKVVVYKAETRLGQFIMKEPEEVTGLKKLVNDIMALVAKRS